MSLINSPSPELLGFRAWCEFLKVCLWDLDLEENLDSHYKEWAHLGHGCAKLRITGSICKLEVRFAEFHFQKDGQWNKKLNSCTSLSLSPLVHRNHLFAPALHMNLPFSVVNQYEELSAHLLSIVSLCWNSLCEEMQIPGEQWSSLRESRFQIQQRQIIETLQSAQGIGNLIRVEEETLPALNDLKVGLKRWNHWVGSIELELIGASFLFASNSSFHPQLELHFENNFEFSVIALDEDGKLLESLRMLIEVIIFEQSWLAIQEPGNSSELASLVHSLIWLPDSPLNRIGA